MSRISKVRITIHYYKYQRIQSEKQLLKSYRSVIENSESRDIQYTIKLEIFANNCVTTQS